MSTTGAADSIDVVELGRAVRRGWRQLLGFTLAGLAAAGAVLLFAPRKFGGTSSMVVRTSASPGSSLLSKLSMPGTSGGGDGPLSSLAGANSSLETEIQILKSRSLIEQAVDSLELQALVRSPSGTPTNVLLSKVDLPGSFKARKYHAERVGGESRYQLTGKDTSVVITPGTPAKLPIGTITLRASDRLPPSFDLTLRDREDAIDRVRKAVNVSKVGGEVLSISFQAADSITAAAVPNSLTSFYLRLRHTKDRSTNEYQVDFLAAQMDTVSRKLSEAEQALRRYRESSGVLDPEVIGKLQVTQAGDLRTSMGTLDVERGALGQLMGQISAGRVSPRELAAYPSFLKSPAINALLGQLTELETQRTLLLERRRENDDSVMALGRSIAAIDTQLTTLGASYSASLDRQRADVSAQLDTIRTALGTFPGTMQSSGRLEREALELARTHGALQVKLVEARLAAISEGGDVRQLDVATPPKQVAFPRPAMTMGIGLGVGLIFGTIFALFAGFLGRWIDDPLSIERTAGVPALRMDAGAPLLMSGQPLSNTLLLVPLDPRANTAGVAERLARTALARALEPTVLDLSRQIHAGNGNSKMGEPTALLPDVGATIRRLEAEFRTVIVRLPSLTSDETAAALNHERPVLLVAPPGRVDRHRLLGAIQTLKRLDVPCAGVVVNRSSDVLVSG